ncbi:M23 family metallopeptidase [Salinispira pacifica]
MNRTALSPPVLILRLLLLVLPAAAAYADYPLIHDLDSSDVLFRQIEQDISRFNQAVRGGLPLPTLTVYRYRIRKGQDLLSVAARLTLPYSAIATLNRMDHRDFREGTTEILIPNMPGIFIPADPRNTVEQLLAHRSPSTATAQHIRVRTAGGETDFRFEPGADFTADERLAFFEALFRFPVKGGIITSYYGMRTNPFSGLFTFHGGIDIEAPIGTDVMASRDGTVIDTGTDREYGNYVELKHEDGYETFYGHLERVFVRLNQKVTSGMIIAKVGNTGLSTGPHLHFEVRYHGKSQDPMKVLAVSK